MGAALAVVTGAAARSLARSLGPGLYLSPAGHGREEKKPDPVSASILLAIAPYELSSKLEGKACPLGAVAGGH